MSEASSTSTVCAVAIGVPDRRSAEPICSRHPGLAVTSSSASVAATCPALRCRGHVEVDNPGLHDRALRQGVDVQDVAQLAQHHQCPVGNRQRAAGQAGA